MRVSDERILELFGQVYASSDDDHVRHVLADALLSIGDPRGELIQLQLHPHGDEVRAMRLLQRHGMTWLGGLRGPIVPLAYERGFLASCLVVADCASVLDRPEWSTVHTIQLASEHPGFAIHPVMRSLRRLVDVPWNVLLELANTCRAQLERVAVETRYDAVARDMLGRYLPANSIGSLTIVAVPSEDADSLRAIAARHPRMKLELLVVPPVAAARDVARDNDRFDSVDE